MIAAERCLTLLWGLRRKLLIYKDNGGGTPFALILAIERGIHGLYPRGALGDSLPVACLVVRKSLKWLSRQPVPVRRRIVLIMAAAGPAMI
jgi:hypothetical protein